MFKNVANLYRQDRSDTKRLRCRKVNMLMDCAIGWEGHPLYLGIIISMFFRQIWPRRRYHQIETGAQTKALHFLHPLFTISGKILKFYFVILSFHKMTARKRYHEAGSCTKCWYFISPLIAISAIILWAGVLFFCSFFFFMLFLIAFLQNDFSM